MSGHRHNHLHRRQGNSGWDEFVGGVESIANDFNPFKQTPTLQAKAAEQSTVVMTVYQTLPKTFDGPVGGYRTLGQDEDASETKPTVTPTPVVQAKPTSSPAKDQSTAVAASIAKAENTASATKGAEKSATEVLPGSIMGTSSVDVGEHSTLALATSTPTTFTKATKNVETSQIAATDAAATSSPTATAADSSVPDTSGAAKAGIAIGVLGGVLMVGLLIWFLFARRRKQLEQQEIENEKANMSNRRVSILSTQTSATAPQLSLRPVTAEFMPTFGARRSSKGAALALAIGGAALKPESPNRSLWERPGSSGANNPENPFGNNAERAYTPTEQPSNPFDNPENVVGVAQTTNSPPRSSPTAGAATLGAAAAGTALTRKASTRKEAPAPLDLTVLSGPPSPAGTEFSVHSVAPGQSPGPSRSAAAISAAGGPPSTAVHRVQLDFNRTLEDEMDLKAGQLVRLLHEYDDGWSLCIRLDRSQQGVVPRTCLSTRPVKPRPAGGPPGARSGPPVIPSPRGPRGPGPNYPPGQRAMTPGSRPQSPMYPMAGRPQSPASMRPQSPATGRMSPHGSRPASPSNGRMSPGPQSPGSRQQRRMTPPGPSPMNPNGGAPQQQYGGPPQAPVGRKPVPGQAY
ncbi:hypothetical protein F4815DRAFT_102634 [Daldinia loculata]|uniref:uncharacterized protein n=1 Tax=Daldinia loculata TaxID=103429 RepID=UPI0020C48886|nr:uncharacterized protein F4817DRAFT_158589 [Daldinia loculata]KAI1645905.1 hypothetical protein F4817DRAFT_158589 [Daldinia loculata]KAI2781175.1 hypothetical protein F4815DRAFT_102634 [Daldinia loculata]